MVQLLAPILLVTGLQSGPPSDQNFYFSSNLSLETNTVATSATHNLTSAQSMAENAQRAGAVIMDVAAIGEESSAGAQQLNASIEEVGASAGELAQMSQSLKELVEQFKVEQDKPNHLRLAA